MEDVVFYPVGFTNGGGRGGEGRRGSPDKDTNIVMAC